MGRYSRSISRSLDHSWDILQHHHNNNHSYRGNNKERYSDDKSSSRQQDLQSSCETISNEFSTHHHRYDSSSRFRRSPISYHRAAWEQQSPNRLRGGDPTPRRYNTHLYPHEANQQPYHDRPEEPYLSQSHSPESSTAEYHRSSDSRCSSPSHHHHHHHRCHRYFESPPSSLRLTAETNGYHTHNSDFSYNRHRNDRLAFPQRYPSELRGFRPRHHRHSVDRWDPPLGVVHHQNVPNIMPLSAMQYTEGDPLPKKNSYSYSTKQHQFSSVSNNTNTVYHSFEKERAYQHHHSNSDFYNRERKRLSSWCSAPNRTSDKVILSRMPSSISPASFNPHTSSFKTGTKENQSKWSTENHSLVQEDKNFNKLKLDNSLLRKKDQTTKNEDVYQNKCEEKYSADSSSVSQVCQKSQLELSRSTKSVLEKNSFSNNVTISSDVKKSFWDYRSSDRRSSYGLIKKAGDSPTLEDLALKKQHNDDFSNQCPSPNHNFEKEEKNLSQRGEYKRELSEAFEHNKVQNQEHSSNQFTLIDRCTYNNIAMDLTKPNNIADDASENDLELRVINLPSTVPETSLGSRNSMPPISSRLESMNISSSCDWDIPIPRLNKDLKNINNNRLATTQVATPRTVAATCSTDSSPRTELSDIDSPMSRNGSKKKISGFPILGDKSMIIENKPNTDSISKCSIEHSSNEKFTGGSHAQGSSITTLSPNATSRRSSPCKHFSQSPGLYPQRRTLVHGDNPSSSRSFTGKIYFSTLHRSSSLNSKTGSIQRRKTSLSPHMVPSGNRPTITKLALEDQTILIMKPASMVQGSPSRNDSFTNTSCLIQESSSPSERRYYRATRYRRHYNGHWRSMSPRDEDPSSITIRSRKQGENYQKKQKMMEELNEEQRREFSFNTVKNESMKVKFDYHKKDLHEKDLSEGVSLVQLNRQDIVQSSKSLHVSPCSRSTSALPSKLFVKDSTVHSVAKVETVEEGIKTLRKSSAERNIIVSIISQKAGESELSARRGIGISTSHQKKSLTNNFVNGSVVTTDAVIATSNTIFCKQLAKHINILPNQITMLNHSNENQVITRPMLSSKEIEHEPSIPKRGQNNKITIETGIATACSSVVSQENNSGKKTVDLSESLKKEPNEEGELFDEFASSKSQRRTKRSIVYSDDDESRVSTPSTPSTSQLSFSPSENNSRRLAIADMNGASVVTPLSTCEFVKPQEDSATNIVESTVQVRSKQTPRNLSDVSPDMKTEEKQGFTLVKRISEQKLTGTIKKEAIELTSRVRKVNTPTALDKNPTTTTPSSEYVVGFGRSKRRAYRIVSSDSEEEAAEGEGSTTSEYPTPLTEKSVSFKASSAPRLASEDRTIVSSPGEIVSNPQTSSQIITSPCGISPNFIGMQKESSSIDVVIPKKKVSNAQLATSSTTGDIPAEATNVRVIATICQDEPIPKIKHEVISSHKGSVQTDVAKDLIEQESGGRAVRNKYIRKSLKREAKKPSAVKRKTPDHISQSIMNHDLMKDKELVVAQDEYRTSWKNICDQPAHTKELFKPGETKKRRISCDAVAKSVHLKHSKGSEPRRVISSRTVADDSEKRNKLNDSLASSSLHESVSVDIDLPATKRRKTSHYANVVDTIKVPGQSGHEIGTLPPSGGRRGKRLVLTHGNNLNTAQSTELTKRAKDKIKSAEQIKPQDALHLESSTSLSSTSDLLVIQPSRPETSFPRKGASLLASEPSNAKLEERKVELRGQSRRVGEPKAQHHKAHRPRSSFCESGTEESNESSESSVTSDVLSRKATAGALYEESVFSSDSSRIPSSTAITESSFVEGTQDQGQCTECTEDERIIKVEDKMRKLHEENDSIELVMTRGGEYVVSEHHEKQFEADLTSKVQLPQDVESNKELEVPQRKPTPKLSRELCSLYQHIIDSGASTVLFEDRHHRRQHLHQQHQIGHKETYGSKSGTRSAEVMAKEPSKKTTLKRKSSDDPKSSYKVGKTITATPTESGNLRSVLTTEQPPHSIERKVKNDGSKSPKHQVSKSPKSRPTNSLNKHEDSTVVLEDTVSSNPSSQLSIKNEVAPVPAKVKSSQQSQSKWLESQLMSEISQKKIAPIQEFRHVCGTTSPGLRKERLLHHVPERPAKHKERPTKRKTIEVRHHHEGCHGSRYREQTEKSSVLVKEYVLATENYKKPKHHEELYPKTFSKCRESGKVGDVSITGVSNSEIVTETKQLSATPMSKAYLEWWPYPKPRIDLAEWGIDPAAPIGDDIKAVDQIVARMPTEVKLLPYIGLYGADSPLVAVYRSVWDEQRGRLLRQDQEKREHQKIMQELKNLSEKRQISTTIPTII